MVHLAYSFFKAKYEKQTIFDKKLSIKRKRFTYKGTVAHRKPSLMVLFTL